MYIPNQNAFDQLSGGLQQSVHHDQELCNYMLSATAALCVCVCIWMLNAPPPPVPLALHRCTHMQRKPCVQQLSLVNFATSVETRAGIYFCSADLRSTRWWSSWVFSRAILQLLLDKFSAPPPRHLTLNPSTAFLQNLQQFAQKQIWGHQILSSVPPLRLQIDHTSEI